MTRRLLLTAALMLGTIGATAAPAAASASRSGANVMCISVLGTPLCLISLF